MLRGPGRNNKHFEGSSRIFYNFLLLEKDLGICLIGKWHFNQRKQMIAKEHKHEKGQAALGIRRVVSKEHGRWACGGMEARQESEGSGVQCPLDWFSYKTSLKHTQSDYGICQFGECKQPCLIFS